MERDKPSLPFLKRVLLLLLYLHVHSRANQATLKAGHETHGTLSSMLFMLCCGIALAGKSLLSCERVTH